MKLEIQEWNEDEKMVLWCPEDPSLNIIFKLAYLDSDLPRDQIDSLAKQIIKVWNDSQGY